MVHFARSKTLGVDVLRGSHQKPFDGKLEYDYILWIDSDIILTPTDLSLLLQSPHQVTCGRYLMSSYAASQLRNYAVVKEWDDVHFRRHGTFSFLTDDDVQSMQASGERYHRVAYAGMGCVLMRRGVLEALEYPYFASPVMRIDHVDPEEEVAVQDDNEVIIQDICSEDVYLCRRLSEAGIPMYLDVHVQVAHMKMVPLM